MAEGFGQLERALAAVGEAVEFPAAGSAVAGVIEVDKNGNITPLAPLTNTRVSLDGIQFKAS